MGDVVAQFPELLQPRCYALTKCKTSGQRDDERYQHIDLVCVRRTVLEKLLSALSTQRCFLHQQLSYHATKTSLHRDVRWNDDAGIVILTKALESIDETCPGRVIGRVLDPR